MVKHLTIALGLILLAGFSIAYGQCRVGGTIRFARGSTSGTVKGTVTAGKAVCYKFHVRDQQDAHLTVNSPGRAVRFGVAQDVQDADEVASDTTDWSGVVKGTYLVSVHIPRGSDTFTLVLTIRAGDLTGANTPADDEGILDPSTVPESGSAVKDFVPSGWKIGGTAEGDLNGDGRPDKVLDLVNPETPDDRSGVMTGPEQQALVILLADGQKFRRGGVSSYLLETIAPQYSVEMAIKNGVLSVHQDYGMSEVVDTTYRFRYEPSSGRFLLIGFDSFYYTRPLSDDTQKVSENHLTGKKTITIGHYKANADKLRETTTEESFKVTKTYLEDVNKP